MRCELIGAMTELRCFDPDRDPQAEAESTSDSVEGLRELPSLPSATEASEYEVPTRRAAAEAPAEDSEDESHELDGPGGLLAELESRQDDVIAQLDALETRVNEVLRDLGVRLDDSEDQAESVA